MIVTIDGPAGAGKSSAARQLAKRLGFHFLDTGAMYRCVTLAAMRKGINLEDATALLGVAEGLTIEVEDDRVLMDGEDVTRTIRTSEITAGTRYAADHPAIRDRLVSLQRTAAEGQDIVTEGRDQSTVVFPHADCKVYLTASERVRAERRHLDLKSRGERVSLQDVLEKQRVRDDRDSTRPVGALIKSKDAIELATDGMTPEQVVDRLLEIVYERRQAVTEG